MELDSIENQNKFGLIIEVAVEVGAWKSEINRELAGSLSFIAFFCLRLFKFVYDVHVDVLLSKGQRLSMRIC